jgi:hypothetical protein
MRSRGESRLWRTIFGVFAAVVIAAAVILFILLTLDRLAWSHMHDRPDLDQWLRTLYSKERGSCCDSSEAETTADPDWRNASEMGENQKCEPSGGVEMLTHPEPIYCVRLENPDKPGDWKWWSVPVAAIVELPNRAGPALIWLVWNNRGSSKWQPYIRCFLPGTLS